MSVLQFCWSCMTTAFHGMIGLALIVLLIWTVVKLVRPGVRFPKPVMYRSQVKNAEHHKEK